MRPVLQRQGAFRVLSPDFTIGEARKCDYAIEVRRAVVRITVEFGLAVPRKGQRSEFMAGGNLPYIRGNGPCGAWELCARVADTANSTMYKSPH